MSRKKRTNPDLKNILGHLIYEMDMLINVSNGLSSGVFGHSVVNNALIESFALHVRNLIDFFWPIKPKNDHVIAEDFFKAKSEWLTICPNIPDNLSNARKRAHKEITHLSYDRIQIKPEEKIWHFIDITKSIQKVFEIFIKNIDQEYKDYVVNKRASNNAL